MRLGVIVALAIVFAATGAQAQGGLPPQVRQKIESAASLGGRNFALSAVVVSAIVDYGAHVEEVVAIAVAAAPDSREHVVGEAIKSFPHLWQRILAGAGAAISPPLSAAPSGAAQETGLTRQIADRGPKVDRGQDVENPAADRRSVRRNVQSFVKHRQRGFYADLGGGLALFQDSDLEDDILTPLGITGELTADPGFAVSGAAGFKFGNGLRTDIEIAYRQNDLDKISVGGFGLTVSADVGGALRSLAVLANAYYDVPLKIRPIPYFGAGIGGARINLDSDDLATDETDSVLAYQLTGGVKFPIASRMSIRVAYKFFATTDAKFGTTEGNYMTHNVEAGLTYNF
jgi:opacity protein-like surface antigen